MGILRSAIFCRWFERSDLPNTCGATIISSAARELAEIINLQPLGAKAKAYQVKQVRQAIVRYRLGEAL